MSKAKPMAAIAQITHWTGVSFAAEDRGWSWAMVWSSRGRSGGVDPLHTVAAEMRDFLSGGAPSCAW
jgi:hypothetical protein